MGGCYSSSFEASTDNLDVKSFSFDALDDASNKDSHCALCVVAAPMRKRLQQDRKADDLLPDLPTRRSSSGVLTLASLHTVEGKKGPNQDSMIAWEDFMLRPDTSYSAVYDGHGPHGHIISALVRCSLPNRLSTLFDRFAAVELARTPEPGASPLLSPTSASGQQRQGSKNEKPCSLGLLDDHGLHQPRVTDEFNEANLEAIGKPAGGSSLSTGLLHAEKNNVVSPSPGGDCNAGHADGGSPGQLHNDEAPPSPSPLKGSALFEAWRRVHLEAYHLMDDEIRKCPGVDPRCSGCTAVSVIVQGKDMIISNLGDSRCILASERSNGSLRATQLTEDLKPCIPTERARIERSMGRVFPTATEQCTQRVWLPHQDQPGLAMSRAFGDEMLKLFGVISVPELFHRQVAPNDLFLVLASDGVWDVLTNQEVVDVVHAAPSRQVAASLVSAVAIKAWKKKLPTSKRDDISVVVKYFLPEKSIEEQRRLNNLSAGISQTLPEHDRPADRQGATPDFSEEPGKHHFGGNGGDVQELLNSQGLATFSQRPIFPVSSESSMGSDSECETALAGGIAQRALFTPVALLR